MPTSATTPGAPVPSTTVAPLMISSSTGSPDLAPAKSDGPSDCSLGGPDTIQGDEAMADWQNHEWKLLIGGELVAGEAGTAPIVNPATEEVVGEAPEASVRQAQGT